MHDIATARASEKFRDWAIISDGRAQYIGKVVEDDGERVALCPAFEWVCPTSIDARQGIVQRGRLVLPLETFSGLQRVDIRPASIVRLAGIDDEGAEELTKALERCDRGTTASSRILVPTPVLRQ